MKTIYFLFALLSTLGITVSSAQAAQITYGRGWPRMDPQRSEASKAKLLEDLRNLSPMKQPNQWFEDKAEHYVFTIDPFLQDQALQTQLKRVLLCNPQLQTLLQTASLVHKQYILAPFALYWLTAAADRRAQDLQRAQRGRIALVMVDDHAHSRVYSEEKEDHQEKQLLKELLYLSYVSPDNHHDVQLFYREVLPLIPIMKPFLQDQQLQKQFRTLLRRDYFLQQFLQTESSESLNHSIHRRFILVTFAMHWLTATSDIHAQNLRRAQQFQIELIVVNPRTSPQESTERRTEPTCITPVRSWHSFTSPLSFLKHIKQSVKRQTMAISCPFIQDVAVSIFGSKDA